MTCPDCNTTLTDTGPRCRDCAGPMPPRRVNQYEIGREIVEWLRDE